MINKCKKAAILATVLGGISIGASVNAATIVVGGASDYSTGTEIGTINGSWVTSYVNTGAPTTDPFQASGWFDVTKYQQLMNEGNDAKLVAYIRSNDPQYKYMTDAEFEAAGAEKKILGYYKNLNLHNIPDELKPGLYSNDVSIHRIVLNGKTYAYLRQTSGTGTIKMPGVAIDLQGWESMGSNQIKGETDSVNAHDAVAKGEYIYLADYTGCQIGVGKVSADGKTIINRSDLTIDLQKDLAENGKVDFDKDAKYYLHGEGMVIDGDDLYILVNVNTSSAWSGYAPSYLIKYSIQDDGSLEYKSHTTMGKNTDMVKPEKFNNHIFATAIGGYQFNGIPNEETSLDYAEIKSDGTFASLGEDGSKIKLPDNVKNKKSEFRGMRILPNGTVYVMRYYLAVTDDHTNMTLYKTTVSNLLAEKPVDWEVIENANNVKGWFNGVDAEYYTKRVWLRKGNELILYVDGNEAGRWNAKEFSHSGTFTTMQAFDVMTPEGISGKLAQLNELANKVINDNAVWNANATVATVTGANDITGDVTITADASKVDLGNNISAAVYAKDGDVAIEAGNLQLQSKNDVATPVGIYAGNGKAVNVKANELNIITQGYEDGNSLTNAIWLDPSAEGAQAKITIEAPVNISMTGGFGGNGIAIQKTDRWGESSTAAAEKAEVIIKGDVSVKGADNQTWGIGVNSENVFSRFNNAGILTAVDNSSVTVDGNVYMDVYGNGIATTAQGSTVTVKGGEITVPTDMNYGYYTLASYLGTINMNTGAEGKAGSETVKLDGDIFALKDTGNINLALTTAESYLNGAIDNGGNVKLYLQNGAIWNNVANNTRYTLDSEDTGSLFGSDRASRVNTFVGADKLENAGAIYQGLNSENIKIDNYSGNAVVLYERDAQDKITGGTVTIVNAEANSTIVARTNYTESLESDTSKIDQVLSEMAGKLYYTAATTGNTNLSGKVEIAEGLMTDAVVEYYSDITFDGANQGQGTIGEVMEVEKHRQEFTGNIAGGITDADPVYGAYVNANGEIDFSNVQTKDENGNDVTAGVIALKGSAGAIIGATDNTKPVTIEMGGNDLVLGAADGASEAVQGIVANTSKVEIKDAGKLTIQANGDASAIYATGNGAVVNVETANEYKVVKLEANGNSDKAVLHAADGAQVEIGGKINITKTSGNDAIFVGNGAQVVLKGGVIGSADDDGVAIRIVDGGKVTINQDGTQKVVTNGDIVFGTKPVEPDQPGGGEPGGETTTPGVYEGANAYIQGGDSNIGNADRYGNCGTFEADSQNVKVDFTYLNRDENNNVLPEEDWVQKVVINGNSELIKSNATKATVTKHATISMAGKDLEATATSSEDGKAAYAIYAVTEGTEGTSNVTIRDAGNIKIVAQNDANGGASAIYADGGAGSAKVEIATRESKKTVTLKANATGNDKAVLHAVNNAEVTIDGIVDITETGAEAVMVGKGSSVTLNGGVIGAADDEEAISLAEGNDVAIRLVDGGKLSINQVPANEYDVAINGDIVLAGESNATAEASKISFNTENSYYKGDIVNGGKNAQNFAVDFSDGADWTGNASGVNLDVTLNGKDTIWKGTYDAAGIADTGLTLRLERSAQWDNSKAVGTADIKSFTTTKRGEVVDNRYDDNTQGFVHMGAGALNIASYNGDATFIYQNTGGVVDTGGEITIGSANEGSRVTMRTGYNENLDNADTREQAFKDLAAKLTYTSYANGENNINGKVEIAEGFLTEQKTYYIDDIYFDANGKGVVEIVDPKVAVYGSEKSRTFSIESSNIEYIDGLAALADFDKYHKTNNPTGTNNIKIDFSKIENSKGKVVIYADSTGIKSNTSVTSTKFTPAKVEIEMNKKDLVIDVKDTYGNYSAYGISATVNAKNKDVTAHVVINDAHNVKVVADSQNGTPYAIWANGKGGTSAAQIDINTVDGNGKVELVTKGDGTKTNGVLYVYNNSTVNINGIVDITDKVSGQKAIQVGVNSTVNINGGVIGTAGDETAIHLVDGGKININQVIGKAFDVVTNGNIVLDGASNEANGGGKITYNTATSAHNGNIVNKSENVQNFAVEFSKEATWNGYVDGVGLDLTLSDGATWKVQDRVAVEGVTYTNSLKSMSGNGGYVEMGIDNVSVGNYSGNTTFIYKNNNGMVAGGGNVTITKAAENSNVTMYTSYNANFENETTRNQALETLAKKLYYTGYQTEADNLTATAMIAEGLLTGEYGVNYYKAIEFGDNGQGTAVGEANSLTMMRSFALRRTAPASAEAAAVVRDVTYSTKDSAHNADIINYTGEKQDFAVAFTNGADWNGNASGVNLDVLLEGADTVWTGSYDEGTIDGTGLTVEINNAATWKVQDKAAGKAKAANTTNVKTLRGTGGFVEMGADNMDIGTYSGSTTFIYENTDGNVAAGGNVTIGDATENSTVTMRTAYNSNMDNDAVRNQAMDDLAGKLFYNSYANNTNLSGIAVISEGLMTDAMAKYYSDITFDAENNGQGSAGEIVEVSGSGNNNSGDGGFQTTETTAVRISKSAMGSSIMMWRNEGDDVMQRMGDLRNGTEENGIWAKYYNGDATFNEAGTYYNSNYKAYQVGYDKKLDNGWTVGAALSYNDAEHKYEMGTKGEGTAVGVTAYGAWNNTKGHFANIAIKGSQLDNEFDVTNATGDLTANGDYSTWGLSVSAEYGRRMEQGNGFYVEPSAKLTIGRVQDAEFTVTTDDGQKMFVEQGGFNSIVGELGLGMGKRFERGTVFTKLALAHEFAGDFNASFMDTNSRIVKSDADFGGSWYEWQIGGNVKMSDNSYFYATYEKAFGGDAALDWRVDAGMRWTF